MKSAHQRYKKLVIISRAGWTTRNGVAYFQDNDGLYIDGVSRFFESVDVISRNLDKAESSSIKYGYQFLNKNIRLISGMERFSKRRPDRAVMSFLVYKGDMMSQRG